MKFVIFVEGHTEHRVLADFVRPFLDSQLSQRIGVHTVLFKGYHQYLDEAPKKAKLYQSDPDTLGIMGLLDIYGLKVLPEGERDKPGYLQRVKTKIEKSVDQAKFRQHFAVYELEAWLLSQPDIFPQAVVKDFPAGISNPEKVNHDEPPAKLLERLYEKNLKTGYKKVTDGQRLFSKLDPGVVYGKCPHFKRLLDDMVSTARGNGL